jgi:hypothetical protein
MSSTKKQISNKTKKFSFNFYLLSLFANCFYFNEHKVFYVGYIFANKSFSIVLSKFLKQNQFFKN